MDGLKSLKKEIEDAFFAYEDEDEELFSELYDIIKTVENQFLKSTLLDILEDGQSGESVDYELLSTMLTSEIESYQRMNTSGN